MEQVLEQLQTKKSELNSQFVNQFIKMEEVQEKEANQEALHTHQALNVILVSFLFDLVFEIDECGFAAQVVKWINVAVSILNFIFMKGPELKDECCGK